MNRKYDSDGHEEIIDPKRLTLGNVLRMRFRAGLPTFSDNVVIGIKVSYGTARRSQMSMEYRHFNTLGEAQKHATSNDWIVVVLARPYLYCSNPFGSIPNYLVGAEKYEVTGERLIDTHKVVVMSTGEYACFMSSPLLHKWEVLVENIGKVYDDLSEAGARATYKVYKEMSQNNEGRAGGENVTLFCDGEIVEEWVGDNTQGV